MNRQPLPQLPHCFGKLWSSTDPACAGGRDPQVHTGMRHPCCLYTLCEASTSALPKRGSEKPRVFEIQFFQPDTAPPERYAYSEHEAIALRIGMEWCGALVRIHPLKVPSHLASGIARSIFGLCTERPTPERALEVMKGDGYVLSYEALGDNRFRVTVPHDIFQRPLIDFEDRERTKKLVRDLSAGTPPESEPA